MKTFAKKCLASLGITSLLLVGLAPSAQAAVSEPAYEAVKAPYVWQLGQTGKGASIAFIDQGVNLTHEYFQGQVVDGFCLYEFYTRNFCPN